MARHLMLVIDYCEDDEENKNTCVRVERLAESITEKANVIIQTFAFEM